jgi:hypothetical protein
VRADNYPQNGRGSRGYEVTVALRFEPPQGRPAPDPRRRCGLFYVPVAAQRQPLSITRNGRRSHATASLVLPMPPAAGGGSNASRRTAPIRRSSSAMSWRESGGGIVLMVVLLSVLGGGRGLGNGPFARNRAGRETARWRMGRAHGTSHAAPQRPAPATPPGPDMHMIGKPVRRQVAHERLLNRRNR